MSQQVICLDSFCTFSALPTKLAALNEPVCPPISISPVITVTFCCCYREFPTDAYYKHCAEMTVITDCRSSVQELEQGRHELRLKLEGCRSEWESQVSDLERDARELSAQVERLNRALGEAERDKSRAQQEQSELTQRLGEQLNTVSPKRWLEGLRQCVCVCVLFTLSGTIELYTLLQRTATGDRGSVEQSDPRIQI